MKIPVKYSNILPCLVSFIAAMKKKKIIVVDFVLSLVYDQFNGI